MRLETVRFGPLLVGLRRESWTLSDERSRKNGFVPDYDEPHTLSDKPECATFARIKADAPCLGSECAANDSANAMQTKDIVRFCVEVEPILARCDIAVVPFGGTWSVSGDWMSELRDENRDKLITEVVNILDHAMSEVQGP